MTRAPLAALLLVSASLLGAPAGPATAAGPIRIGALTEAWGPNPQFVGLRDGLQALGYKEEEHFVIGVRFTRGDPEALHAAARDLVKQGADILVTGGGAPTQAAKGATTGLPIVFISGDDPVGRGLVQSFARPGGNITGVVDLGIELAGKRLQLFQEMIPGLKRVLVVYAVNSPYAILEARAYRDAAAQLGISLVEKPVSNREEAQAAFERLRRREVHGVLVSSSLAWNVPGLAIEATSKQGIPSIFPAAFYVQEGGLAAYGPDYYASGRQAARLVDKIIKGARPADIPVESNPRIELVINLKVARKLALQIPPAVLSRADRVIE